MGPSVATAVAFAASGTAWLAGFALFDASSSDGSFLQLLGGYVALGSVLLGIRRHRLVSTLTGLWVAAVGILAVLFSGGGTATLDLLLALLGGLIYGTIAFVAWVAFGLIALRLLGHLPDPAPAAFADESR